MQNRFYRGANSFCGAALEQREAVGEAHRDLRLSRAGGVNVFAGEADKKAERGQV